MAHPDRFLLAGVMGWPVMHSRSPMLHNHWFGKQALAGTYLPLAIPPDRLEAALRALPALGFSGCNLTIPHKEAALAIVDDADPVARRIGAVSCVTVRPDGSLHGANNDGYGFIHSILEEAPDWRAETGPIVVIGAGGASRAVAHALAERGAPEIRLVNRTFGRAHGARRRDRRAGRAPTLGSGAARRSKAPPCWSTRPARAWSASRRSTSRLDALPRAAIVVDIVYVPRETPLLAEARRRGNHTVGGLGMLLHQARPAWRSWFGIEPEVTPELRALIEATL